MRPRVLLTDGEERATLAACRSLRAAGYDVTAMASSRLAPTLWSRDCSERLPGPARRDDPRGLAAALRERAKSGRYAVLLPASDVALATIAQMRVELEPHVAIGLPASEAIERSLDRAFLTSAAADAGMGPPPELIVADPAAAVAGARELGFPVLLKPRHAVVERDGRARKLESRLVVGEAALERALSSLGTACVMQRWVDAEELSCAGVFADGALIAMSVARYTRMWPPGAGDVCFATTVSPPPRLRPRIEELLATIGWQGIFELELLRDRSGGAFMAIDLNPRLYGSLALASRAGAPHAAIWCDWLCGRERPFTLAAPGVHYRWLDADLRHALRRLRRRELLAAIAALRPHRRVVHAHFAWRDPLPALARELTLGSLTLRRFRANRG
jgi:predicted ATP-grasp superfamily ATP-dependent carboligase